MLHIRNQNETGFGVPVERTFTIPLTSNFEEAHDREVFSRGQDKSPEVRHKTLSKGNSYNTD